VDDAPEQFSAITGSALRASAESVAQLALRYADLAAAMRGSTRDVAAIHSLNDELAEVVGDLNDRILDHSGTLALVMLDAEDEDEEFDDPGDSGPAAEAGTRLSVVSRWDVAVTDPGALLEAGRAAHLRQHPEDEAEDARLAIPDVGAALWEVLGDDGHLWCNVPGIEPLCGLKAGIAPEDGETATDGDDLGEALTLPAGEVFRTEAW
jgi:hypothetical protein